MSSDGYPSISGRHAAIMGISMMILSVALIGWLATHPPTVKAQDEQRFELISTSDWMGNGTYRYQFTVFHDRVSGQEFVCAVSDMHYNPSCLSTGRNWK